MVIYHISSFQFDVVVRDNRITNPKSATASVSITVQPLAGAPIFTLNRYEVYIPIITPVNTVIYNQISATDANTQVWMNDNVNPCG